jgi:hypothetical protein
MQEEKLVSPGDMAIIESYVFYDKQSKVYDTPFFCFDDVAAKRHFIMQVRKKDGLISQFKEKFELYRIGKFSRTSGKFYSGAELVMEGKNIQREE